MRLMRLLCIIDTAFVKQELINLRCAQTTSADYLERTRINGSLITWLDIKFLWIRNSPSTFTSASSLFSVTKLFCWKSIILLVKWLSWVPSNWNNLLVSYKLDSFHNFVFLFDSIMNCFNPIFSGKNDDLNVTSRTNTHVQSKACPTVQTTKFALKTVKTYITFETEAWKF